MLNYCHLPWPPSFGMPYLVLLAHQVDVADEAACIVENLTGHDGKGSRGMRARLDIDQHVLQDRWHLWEQARSGLGFGSESWRRRQHADSRRLEKSSKPKSSIQWSSL